ncbi:MAG: fimbrillin family protein, partial [Bacteroidales bacterium]|nr:fimbrillin family protein [Bacteroidales bacterium]
GHGWALVSAAKYSAYYPFSAGNYGDADALKGIEVSYLGQSQAAKNTFGVGAFDYMACTKALPSFTDSNSPGGTCTFNFKHLGALLVLDITFPKAADLSSLELVCNNDLFPETGTVNLSQETAEITPAAIGGTLALGLGGMHVAAGETARFFMMCAPADLTSELPTVKVTTTTGAVMSKKLGSSYRLKAGKAYSFSAALESTVQPTEEVISLAQESLSINYPFNTVQLQVTSNISYTLSIVEGGDWISVTSYNRITPTLDVKINNSSSDRTAILRLKSNSSALTKYVTITQSCPPAGSPIPVSHIMPCCRWNNYGTTFLVNNTWISYHDYNDISQCRSILKTIAKAGIRVVCVDFTNQAQWDSQWESDNFKGRLENIAQVCGEIGMEWFLFIGNLSTPNIGYWNGIAEKIWNSYARLNHYHYKDGRPMLLVFMPGSQYTSAINKASAADKTYLGNGDKFTIGTCQVNSAITPRTTDGWGYRNYSQSSDGAVRFVCPNSGVAPETWARIDADTWSSRMDWGLQATRYIVIGSYDDTCDSIFWGIADVSASTTDCHKNSATINDPYVYYNIVKEKLLGE